MSKGSRFSFLYYFGIFAFIIGIQALFYPGQGTGDEISYLKFKNHLKAGKIERVVILPEKIVGQYRSDTTKPTSPLVEGPQTPWRLRLPTLEKQMARQFWVSRIPDMRDERLLEELEEAKVDFAGKLESNFFRNFFLDWVFPLAFFFILWGFIFRRFYGGQKGILDLGKNRSKIIAEESARKTKFSDVAGIDEAVEEVKELVDFLKHPDKYGRLGGKLPKGILLVGPPGTGKTLLAKAVAGEAGVPFFSISGSDFVEMFVGVGASRVRDLFQQAKQKSPCIIFIDEIDAIGKRRGANTMVSGGYDERENTLNQLLVEMDGFDQGVGVIIMGATNRPEVLDPALLRPGRFDRQILVDRPDMKGREDIFKIHTRQLKLDTDVDLKRLAAQTPGFAGAEIANVCNEAALLAVRKEHSFITMKDFEEAIERVVAGLEKKNKLINPKERKIVAYHESGHAIVGYFTKGAEEVQKVSIVPRGIGALGYTLQVPTEDRYLMTKSELLGKIKGLLGGRAAEEIVFGEVTTGASNDLERVTQLARNMITVYGMGEQLANISLAGKSGPEFLGYSDNTYRRSEKLEEQVDEEVKKIIAGCYKEAKELLTSKRDLLEKMAQRLMEREVLDSSEIRQILGKKPVENNGLK